MVSIDPPAVGSTCAESKIVLRTALPFTADFFDDGLGGIDGGKFDDR